MRFHNDSRPCFSSNQDLYSKSSDRYSPISEKNGEHLKPQALGPNACSNPSISSSSAVNYRRFSVCTVSVIIPAYNAGKTIGQCLQALSNQSYPSDSYEIIVVDDGSVDNTAAVVKDYPIKYIYQSNQGPAVARNNGADRANGQIILFTDADCVPDTDWINQMAKFFDQTEVMAVKGAYKTRQKSVMARFAQLEFEERFEMLGKVETIDMVDTYSAGFRRKIFLNLGGFDPSFPLANNEDTELSYLMSALNLKMVFNREAIVYHLDHPDSIKKYVCVKFWRGYWRMAVYRRFPDKMIKDTYTPQILKFQILFLYLSLVTLLFVGLLPSLIVLSSLGIILFGLLTLPFTIFATKRDWKIGALSPFLLLIRAASLGAGVIWAVLRKHPLKLTGRQIREVRAGRF